MILSICQTTITKPLFFSMNSIMFSMTKHFKIFYSIIRFVTIYMVNMLISFKLSTKTFFYNTPMLKRSILWTNPNRYVVARCFNTPTFPHKVFIAIYSSRYRKVITFFRTIFSFVVFRLELFATVFATLTGKILSSSNSFFEAKTTDIMSMYSRTFMRTRKFAKTFIVGFAYNTVLPIYFTHNKDYITCIY